MRAILAMLPLVGGIEPSGISACGDLICRSDHICIDGESCVDDPAQLAACGSAPDRVLIPGGAPGFVSLLR